MRTRHDVEADSKMSLLTRLFYYADKIGVPITDACWDLARGYSDGSLIGYPVLFPYEVFQVYGRDSRLAVVQSKHDTWADAYPLVIPWVGKLAEYNEDWVMSSSCDGFGVPLTEPRPPQVCVEVTDTELVEEYLLALPPWDVRIVTPRTIRDWKHSWNAAYHASDDIWRIRSYIDFNETGEIEHLLPQEELEDAQDRFDAMTPAAQEAAGGWYGFITPQVQAYEHGIFNTEGEMFVDPLARVDLSEAQRVSEAFHALKLDSTAAWSALGARFHIDPESERYPWG